MNDQREEYVLGEDVTSQAAAKARKGTMVLSVRLPIDEFAEIDAASREAGKIPSQIVRDAIREYLHHAKYSQPTITISLDGGTTLATGAPTLLARASSAENLTARPFGPPVRT